MALLTCVPFWCSAADRAGDGRSPVRLRSTPAPPTQSRAVPTNEVPSARNWAGVSPHDPERERALVDAIQAHDPEALGDLYLLYYGELSSYGMSIVAEKHVIEDVLQDVFLRAWIRRFQGVAAADIPYYLYGAVRRGLLQMIRNDHRAHRAKTVIRETSYGAAPAVGTSVVEAHELAAVLARAVASLPDRCREVFELSRLGQLSRQDIARTMGISVNTVKTQLSRALQVIGEAVDACDARSSEPEK